MRYNSLNFDVGLDVSFLVGPGLTVFIPELSSFKTGNDSTFGVSRKKGGGMS